MIATRACALLMEENWSVAMAEEFVKELDEQGKLFTITETELFEFSDMKRIELQDRRSRKKRRQQQRK